MTSPETAVQTAGWSDTLKGHAQEAWNKIQESHSVLFVIAVYGGIGFISGYLCKKYAHFLAFLIILAVLVSLLQQLDYLSFSINWTKIHSLMGIAASPDASDMSLVNYFFDWMKNNFAAVVSYAVGFLLGLRFG